ncbi:MAG: hypothetical protein NWP73_01665, partial [Ilumatobacteraceae bacterium]|nr:hypothetical protein [Ilumatobacteraceae bacterium]
MTTPSHDDETQELQSGESVHVTGETPVVRSLDDVPVEVLEELTEAFEGISIVDEDGPEYFEGHVLGGYDIVSDDDLTHARAATMLDHGFQRRDHGFAAIEAEPLGSDVFAAEEFLVLLSAQH